MPAEMFAFVMQHRMQQMAGRRGGLLRDENARPEDAHGERRIDTIGDEHPRCAAPRVMRERRSPGESAPQLQHARSHEKRHRGGSGDEQRRHDLGHALARRPLAVQLLV